jgi:flagellar basal-body rod protein FlgB
MSDYSYDLIKKGLDMSALRQGVISSNIANINTPDYKVNKVEFEDILAKVRNEKVVPEPVVKRRTGTRFNENGNNVDLDLEMTELAANEIYYTVLVYQLNSKLSDLNYVINK